MNKNWPTKEKDLHIAEAIMEEYAKDQNCDSLGLFELVLNQEEKKMDFRLASWVLTLAQQYNAMYGANQGDFVTRQVISRCITKEHTVH